jgi:micrococcal nuclease
VTEPRTAQAADVDPVWHYPRARSLGNYDGDTVTLEVDVGFSTLRRITVRLARVNTPELKDAGGAAARDRTRELVFDEVLKVTTIKDRTEKYGRYLAEIWLADGRNLADVLVEEGHAWPYASGRR